ncbi:MAG: CRISPR system precrRNA processing endoribonuclease RAMP protein Cas6 [Kiritimatiellia bacterium]
MDHAPIALPDSLSALMAGLRFRAVRGQVVFDRARPIRHLATATLRGLTGFMLMKDAPNVFTARFKPPQTSAGSAPGCFVFTPLHNEAVVAGGFAFRMTTWDHECRLAETCLSIWSQASGLTFGNSEARIAAITGDLETLEFAPYPPSPGPVTLRLRTPIRAKHNGAFLQPGQLTLGLLVHLSINRLNLLSAAYGNKARLDPVPWLAETALTPEPARSLSFVKTAHQSSTKQRDLPLDGIVGHLDFPELPVSLQTLFLAMELLHLGQATAEGCGAISLEPTKAS